MDSYLSSENKGITLTVNKSKFIAFSYHMQGEYKDILKKLKTDYPDATHICWAYKYFDNDAMINLNDYIVYQNSSDDGEPSGTAGMPILSAINACKLDNVLVCIVRYFGGVKLGTAGLVKAYNKAAKLVLDKTTSFILASECTACLNYSQYSLLQSLATEGVLTIKNATFTTNINVDFVISNANLSKLNKVLSEVDFVCTKRCYIKETI